MSQRKRHRGSHTGDPRPLLGGGIPDWGNRSSPPRKIAANGSPAPLVEPDDDRLSFVIGLPRHRYMLHINPLG